jgi:hypothetical protein
LAVIVVAVDGLSEARVSDEDDGTRLDTGDGMDGSNDDSGRRSTMTVTVFITCGTRLRPRGDGTEYRNTHLDQPIGGVAVPKIRDGEGLAAIELPDLHGEQGDGTFLGTLRQGIGLACIHVDSTDLVHRLQKIEYEAEGYSKREEIPELGDRVG